MFTIFSFSVLDLDFLKDLDSLLQQSVGCTGTFLIAQMSFRFSHPSSNIIYVPKKQENENLNKKKKAQLNEKPPLFEVFVII